MHYQHIFYKKENFKEMVSFSLLKKIIHHDMSTFYSFINKDDKIIGFSRSHYWSRNANSHQLTDSLDIINLDENKDLLGEDPRTFYHNGHLYTTDNYCHDNHIQNHFTNKRVKVQLNFKNTSYISHNNKLYGIHRMMPFEFYEIDPETGISTRVKTEEGETNSEYRGGTPGYLYAPNVYVGFGHITKNHPHEDNSKPMTHTVFLWKVDFNDSIPKLTIKNVDIPTTKMLLDPTSLIKKNGKTVLVICESDEMWHNDQEFSTCFYELNGLNII